MKTPTFLFAVLLAGCSSVRQPLLPSAAAELASLYERRETLGEHVYSGRVQLRGADAEDKFRYERWVEGTGETLTSTHLTLALDGSEVLVHSAQHDHQYALKRFTEVHGQRGLVATVRIDADNTAHFDVSQGERHWTRTEPGVDPVHVGPTLFGHVLAHWDELMEGDRLPVRFAVTQARRTYRFEIRLLETDPTRTRFEMRPTSPVVAWAVTPMHLTFDTATRIPVRFEGLVPPLLEPDLQPFEGRVDYEMASEDYR